MNNLLLALSGALVGTGLYLALAIRYPARPHYRDSKPPHLAPIPPKRLAAVLGAAFAVFLLTGWPVGALLAAAAAWFLPALLGPDRGHSQRLAVIDAVAAFTEMLRDTLTASAGLNQALTVASAHAPEAIRPAADRLAQRIEERGTTTRQALRAFADEIQDSTADLVALALASASEHPTRDLAGLLSSLAATAREQAAMRTRIAVARARTRTAVRIVTGTTLALAAVLLVADRHYLAPYGSAAGQLVLVIVGAFFGLGFSWLRKLSAVPENSRLWATQEEGKP
ncbi:type II secretion system F family protein [Actinocrinis puniceicyclus]|uniref:Type II secretion system F family protein n=1 Tax=Actinocrinis puniceicyclus TaxID=977794 RepID=A0A8J8BH84_9ACTN|nr:type II secretion system F family protein [Actinocrinis puniceicyclus]MBS2966534.1 type II secretion system F family protein [Actinocrinis puniceicyclus]